MDILENKIILITGGTGSIGQKLIEVILKEHSPKTIRIFSRDESKQFQLIKKLKKSEEKLRFFIGDIRDKERLQRATNNVDVVLHLAALKHVGACEYNPFEAIKTNIIGLQNLMEVCIDNNIEKLLFTSTDKAATPCNTMGVTKLLGEKLVTAANYYKGDVRTIFYSVRFGNVLGSRGSLVPLIEYQIKNNLPIELTHKEMTRYIMGNETALNLILKTLEIAQGGEVFVLKMKSVKIVDLIDVLVKNFAKKYKKLVEKVKIREVGIFAGEKLYEELFSIEESKRTYEVDDMYVIVPQITEISQKINLNLFPNIKKFDINKPFNSKDGPFISKNEIYEYLVNNKILQ